MTKVAINGFGRIGRGVLRAIRAGELEIVAINDLTDAHTLAHLLKYDSVHGRFSASVEATSDAINVDGRSIQVFAERDPSALPWKSLGIDVVIEATGLFRERDQSAAHLDAGAKRVIISAPGKNVDATFCMGVNHQAFDPQKHFVVSNASCTTNCLAPVVRVVDEAFGLVHGMMTTVHSVTNDQRILDLPHSDLRRARAAFESMIPTTTGAAQTLALVMPEMTDKLNGMAIRVPTRNVSLIDLVVAVDQDVTKDTVVDAFRSAAQAGPLAPYLAVSDEPLVSIDYNANQNSATIDLAMVDVIGDRLVKIIAWYDNESGYSKRVVDLAKHISDVAALV
jgi:glyceraldehyde 3-phosphate dehydrogenase